LLPSFEVWGPSKVEPEDLEESVVSLVAAPRWMVEISVPAGGKGMTYPMQRPWLVTSLSVARE